MPTALERAGDFSQTRNAAGAIVPIYDPATTVGTGATAARTQFAGNLIPASRLNEIGNSLTQFYPLPNAPSLGPNVFRRNAPERIDNENGIARGDVQLSTKDSIFGRYAQTNSSTANEAALPYSAANPGVATVSAKGIGAGYTRIITNSLINEFRFSWGTLGILSVGTQARNEVTPGALDLAVTSGTPSFNVSNISGLGGQVPCCGNSPLQKTSGVFDFANNVSWSRGKHQYKVGGEFLWIRPRTFSTSTEQLIHTAPPPPGLAIRQSGVESSPVALKTLGTKHSFIPPPLSGACPPARLAG